MTFDTLDISSSKANDISLHINYCDYLLTVILPVFVFLVLQVQRVSVRYIENSHLLLLFATLLLLRNAIRQNAMHETNLKAEF